MILEVSPVTSVVLLFGTCCVGKSTVGKLLANKLAKCAWIEVDALRYMVEGGLVACSRGIEPGKDPEEYERQCRLGEENAACLAINFSRQGFSSVVEGLSNYDCQPNSKWAEKNLPGLPVWNIMLVCSPEKLAERWRTRNQGHKPHKGVIDELQWCLEHSASFDLLVDTSEGLPEEHVETILEKILIDREGDKGR